MKGAIPFLCGACLGYIALLTSGPVGIVWFGVGVAFGGWVPLVLMPWLRRKNDNG